MCSVQRYKIYRYILKCYVPKDDTRIILYYIDPTYIQYGLNIKNVNINEMTILYY